jgi:hypothetical protein
MSGGIESLENSALECGVCWLLPVESVVETGYGFGVSTRTRIEWLWLIQHRMTAKHK